MYLNVSKNLRADGYHEIKSIMQSIGLSDELHFEVSDKSEGESSDENGVDGNGISISCNNMEIPLNYKNLVHRAVLLILKNFDLEYKYRIRIDINKNIPVGAGLAGGSTNAAATLVAMNELFDLKLSDKDLMELGNQVGSDVPFCISGGTALVEGKGEVVSKLPDLPFYWLVLAINGKKFSTGDVYDRFDLIGKQREPVHENLIDSLGSGDFDSFFAGLENDLEKAVIIEDKMVVELKKNARDLGAFSTQMTGSGPAIFAFCSDLRVARNVFNGLSKITKRVFLSHTTPSSNIIHS
jgi:4-diphosphocytidyl-2-C-methyl-D-erythritol kinase